MRILLFLIITPCFAQLDRDTFYELLDGASDTTIVNRISQECIEFRMNQADLDRAMKRPEVLLALLQCLYDRTPGVEAKSVTIDKPNSEGETASTIPSSSNPRSTNRFYLTKLVEALNTLSLANEMRNPNEKMTMKMDALPLIANLIREHGHLINSNLLRDSMPEGFQAPSWVVEDLEKASDGKKKGYSTLAFNVHKNVMFEAGRGKKGAQVFLGLYRVDTYPDGEEIYKLEDHLIYSHREFPITYDRTRADFEYHQLQNRGMRLSLGKILNKKDPLALFPGNWVLEVIAMDGEDRLQSRDKIQIQIENGHQYVLGIKWETNRQGVRQLIGSLETR